jgi:predicted permease
MRVPESLAHDLRDAFRAMRRAPVITAAAILSLALGIGANTAIFGLINAVMLRSLPVRSPQELVQLGWTSKKRPQRFVKATSGRGVQMFGQNVRLPFSLETYDFIRQHATMLSGVVGRFDLAFSNAVLVAQGRADTVKANLVSGNFFDVLGVPPEAGRLLNDADDREGAPPVVSLSYAYWLRRFGANPSVIGTSVVINGASFTVVGVVSQTLPGLDVGSDIDLYAPLHCHPLIMAKEGFNTNVLHAPDWWWVEIIGRRKPGVSQSQARAELAALFKQSLTPIGSEPVNPDDYPALTVASPNDIVSGIRYQFSKPLLVLWTIVGVVLLIACANVANLLLARAAARRKEMAMRNALGARAGRLFRQMIVESVLLAAIGGFLGLAIAWWGSRVLVKLVSSETNPLSLDTRADASVLLFLTALSLTAGLLFGLVPAIRSSRVDVNTLIKGAPADRNRFGLGRSLVIVQVALSLALLIGAGLYLRTFWNLRHVALGFNPENVLTFKIAPKRGGYAGDRQLRLAERMLMEIQAVPGVRIASYSHIGLLNRVQTSGPFSLLGEKPDDSKQVKILFVAPNFFDAMQIPVSGGRAFTAGDAGGTPRVAIVNEATVREYFNHVSPIGRQITYFLDKYQKPMEITGVVKDAKYTSVTSETEPILYLPVAQNLDAVREMVFVVRTAGDPRAAASAIREIVHGIDSDLPVFAMTTETTLRDENLRDQRLMADLGAAFAALALFLAAIGLYGVISHSISRRTSEIGIRMALGADRSRVLGQILRESMVLVGAGILGGTAIALIAGRVIASQLYGLQPRDPSTMIAAGGLILLVAVVASLIPARRAAAIDPMSALRHE